MTGTLDRIEARAAAELAGYATGRADAQERGCDVCECFGDSEAVARDALALVEVAKAAQTLSSAISAYHKSGHPHHWYAVMSASDDTDAALARLEDSQ